MHSHITPSQIAESLDNDNIIGNICLDAITQGKTFTTASLQQQGGHHVHKSKRVDVEDDCKQKDDCSYELTSVPVLYQYETGEDEDAFVSSAAAASGQ